MLSTAPAAPLRVLGLTGGVGAGKSTIARWLAEELPGTVLDADAMVASLFEKKAVLARLSELFGAEILEESGHLNRKALGQRVFQKPEARRELEELLHPLVRLELAEQLQKLAFDRPDSWVILDIPLLREGGLDSLCQVVIHVVTSKEERSARAMRRHGWDLATWEAREAAQMPEQEKSARADYLISNGAEHALGNERALPSALAEALEALRPQDLGPQLAALRAEAQAPDA